MFIVAACNPHRGNSLASHSQKEATLITQSEGDNPHRHNSLASHIQKETWVRGSYYVRQLHPTLHFLMWDYGSLSEDQEREYINAKMRMCNRQMPDLEVEGCEL